MSLLYINIHCYIILYLTEGFSKEHKDSDESDSENTVSFSTSHEDIYGTHKRTRYALKVNLCSALF